METPFSFHEKAPSRREELLELCMKRLRSKYFCNMPFLDIIFVNDPEFATFCMVASRKVVPYLAGHEPPQIIVRFPSVLQIPGVLEHGVDVIVNENDKTRRLRRYYTTDCYNTKYSRREIVDNIDHIENEISISNRPSCIDEYKNLCVL